MIVHATVTSGLGRAAPRMLTKLRDGVFEPLSFRPYPGSLNVAMTAEHLRAIHGSAGSVTDARGRRYWPARVRAGVDADAANAGGVRCYVLLFRQHAELLAPVHLRSTLRLRDGSSVTIRLEDPT